MKIGLYYFFHGFHLNTQEDQTKEYSARKSLIK